ncbi:indole-3-glycerol phosphate synthase [Oceanobacillus iheyensis HTE831]|uniref:Indole-3-glycerol phosphate synthase n=1 Tax=Oceanobacillus iheyensis (strain DSM 14371 / CIP 107618 / JCM 11309 / KCTC 3954 / HTE831) TaxID=221109 RepID=TRPC_OCEIH|nr:indole-3-glycerol phosphate synthase TrpC [Oceanobacillus iheyensis]Q8ESU2.1 RecName: Full=Indole-3-glycerol phosphate synthase; Short=IGPS [Oceanobacillus iheyensis HTE831]BAC12480.1 indole-3-glycerol phosphate synthase [Oceanobacillus iheyensis HTE831]
MTFLAKILEEKQTEVNSRKQEKIDFGSRNIPVHSFIQLINQASSLSIIAEIKRASPSKGEIQMDIDPVEQAIKYEQAGASAISVLTDQRFFKGSLNDLQQVSEAVSIPVLCKDFIIDEIQIDDAKDAGASIILLILAALPLERFQELYNYATKQGLEVICEVHTAEELKNALTISPAIIGINNRNLKSFDVDLQTTKQLAQRVDTNKTIIISESGMRTASDATLAAESGAKAILVGETFMRSNQLETDFNNLRVPLVERSI